MNEKAATEIAIGIIVFGVCLMVGLINFGEDKITITIEHIETSPDVSEVKNENG